MQRVTKALNYKKLKEIWDQVPLDYYENGEKLNFGQFLWHSHKRKVLGRIFDEIEQTRLFKKKLRVLDLGCADGHMTSWLKSKWKKGNIYGVDVSDKLINGAKKKYPDIKFTLADAHKLPYSNDFFDLVICSEVLEHVVKPDKVCKEVYRVLSPEGFFIAELDTGNFLFSFLWFFWTRFGSGRVWRNAHLHQFNHKSLPKLLKKNGFIVAKEIVHHLGMATTTVATKKLLF